jgi:hypothetical protein
MKTLPLLVVAALAVVPAAWLEGCVLVLWLGVLASAFGAMAADVMPRFRPLTALFVSAGLAVAAVNFLAHAFRPGAYWPVVGLGGLEFGAVLVVASALGAASSLKRRRP